MVLGMVVEAFRGAVEEVKNGQTALVKVQRACSLTSTIFRELLGMLGSLPYAYHATSLWRNAEKKHHRQQWRFSLLRNVRYGHRERNLLDVYSPSTCDGKSSLPVLMFVHGGVWASGDKSLFSPIGAALAHHGVVALLVQYSLYPQVLAKEQVKEISSALSWAMDNVAHYGGDPSNINVMGHSSGAHLCGMLLWERAMQNLGLKTEYLESADVNDKRYPRSFLGLSGVYNIAEHFKYEQGRGVAAISCMKPAMGGPKGFSSMSPELLFSSLNSLKCGGQEVQTIRESELANELSNANISEIDWRTWADQQPPFLLFASDNDKVVPPHTSLKFQEVLGKLGCRSGASLQEGCAHDDFVCWIKGLRGDANPAAKALIEEVIDVVKDDKKLSEFLQH